MSERRVPPPVVSAQPFQVDDLRPVERLFEDDEGKWRLEAALSRYPEARAALLPMLAYAQERNGWVSRDHMEQIAAALELTPAYVRSVATFYTMYNKRPVGKYLVQVCTCISCHLNDGDAVFAAFLDQTGVAAGEISEDGKYTVIEAECLGACGFPTAVQINDRYVENVTPDTVADVIAGLEAEG